MNIVKELRDNAVFAHKVTECSLKKHLSTRAADEINSLTADRDCWIQNAKNLQKGYNELDTRFREAHAENQHLRGLLLWALYHHQGGCSGVGKPIRKALGIGEYAPLTEEEIIIAKMAAERA